MIGASAGMQAFSQQCKGVLVGLMLGMGIIFFLQATSIPTIAPPFYQVWRNASNRNTVEGKTPKELAPAETMSAFQSSSGNAVNMDHGDTPSLTERLRLLLSRWEASSIFFSESVRHSIRKDHNLESSMPKAPHLENCIERTALNMKLDAWGPNNSLPYWKLWKGEGLGLHMDDFSENSKFGIKNRIPSLYPPWVEGSDEDNLPLTREVQAQIWKHQHRQDCQNSSLRFLLADWETNPGFGIGAQISSMAGLLAIAMNEERILVSNYYNRADHEECSGSNHARWSCYFLSETSKKCRDRALFLASQPSAWAQGLITGKSNYTSKRIWSGKPPRRWGRSWEAMQPTTQIHGKLLIHHKAADTRWWRAQAVRYLMRFPSTYMCSLLNKARHIAFGVEAAKMVLDSLQNNLPEEKSSHRETDIERFIWKVYKPWLPRPLVSIHVRQGDKAKEMEVAGFEDYMKLAQQLRHRFPEARNVWLSTEMQDVIEQSKSYSSSWNIYFTNVSRQTANTSMPAYEASLGRATSTNYPLVNFLMSVEADFFIGALGSTWCYLIDGMRMTGGKVMAGYLSVNKDRFW